VRGIPGIIAKVRHETCARIDLIPLPGETLPSPPEELAQRLPSGAHPIAQQHRSALFDAPAPTPSSCRCSPR
jgi:hypothetical protein